MKVLWLTLADNKEALYGFTERLSQLYELTCHWLTGKEAKNIARIVGGPQIKGFDRVVVMLPLPLLVKQSAYLRCIPDIVLIQPDLPPAMKAGTGDAEKFLRLLPVMPWVRLLIPAGEGVSRLEKLGVDLGLVPLGLNALWFRDNNENRRYQAAILADPENPPLRERKSLLFDIKTQNKLQIFDIAEGQALVDQLNQAGIVICNDQGCARYRTLNFQAMACGAALMTWDRGARENQWLGFEDMVNVVLYQDARSAQAKINFLKRHGDALDSIRESGKALALEKHSNRALAEKLAEYLVNPLQRFEGDDIEDALRFRFFR
ncbi:MAG: glycosyltransferase [Ketobacteraceae bacterium]|nr:glycosyltransferase [Ketobacteraceae bacterium]